MGAAFPLYTPSRYVSPSSIVDTALTRVAIIIPLYSHVNALSGRITLYSTAHAHVAPPIPPAFCTPYSEFGYRSDTGQQPTVLTQYNTIPCHIYATVTSRRQHRADTSNAASRRPTPTWTTAPSCRPKSVPLPACPLTNRPTFPAQTGGPSSTVVTAHNPSRNSISSTTTAHASVRATLFHLCTAYLSVILTFLWNSARFKQPSLLHHHWPRLHRRSYHLYRHILRLSLTQTQGICRERTGHPSRTRGKRLPAAMSDDYLNTIPAVVFSLTPCQKSCLTSTSALCILTYHALCVPYPFPPNYF